VAGGGSGRRQDADAGMRAAQGSERISGIGSKAKPRRPVGASGFGEEKLAVVARAAARGRFRGRQQGREADFGRQAPRLLGAGWTAESALRRRGDGEAASGGGAGEAEEDFI